MLINYVVSLEMDEGQQNGYYMAELLNASFTFL